MTNDILTAEQRSFLNDVKAYVHFFNRKGKTDDYERMDRFHENKLAEEIAKGVAEGKTNSPSLQKSAITEDDITASYNAEFADSINNELNMASRLRSMFNIKRNEFQNTSYGSLFVESRKIQKSFHDAKIVAERPTGATNAFSFFLKNIWLVYGIILVFGFFELPLNNTVFEAFRLNAAETFIAACLLVIAVPFAAHYCGKSFKQWSFKGANKVWALTYTLFFFIFVFTMSFFRYAFFQASETYAANISGDANIPLSELMANVQLSSALSSPEFWAPFVFNSLLLLVGIGLGYMAHDSNDTFEKNYLKYHVERPKILARMNKMEVAEDKKERTIGTPSMIKMYQNTLSEIIDNFDALRIYISNFATHANSRCIATITNYRDSNRSARTDPSTLPTDWTMGAHPGTLIVPDSIVDETLNYSLTDFELK